MHDQAVEEDAWPVDYATPRVDALGSVWDRTESGGSGSTDTVVLLVSG